jgi:glycosyltransferase involved in cell wall biosynthesis
MLDAATMERSPNWSVVVNDPLPVPRVSVVLAMYNSCPYVEEAIESILEQTYRDFELLLIDDASSDATLDVAHAYAARDPRIRVLANDHNVGQSVSLNRGILAARGELVAIMDADDVAMPTRIEAQVACLDERPEIGVVGCLADALDEPTGERRASSARADASWLDGNIVMFHPTMLVRRELYATHGLYDPRYVYANDYELQSRFAAGGVQLHVLDESLMVYRIHGTSTTSLRRRQMVRTSLRVSARTVLRHRRLPTRRGWQSIARDAAIFAYLSLGLQAVVPYGVGKRLWPAR